MLPFHPQTDDHIFMKFYWLTGGGGGGAPAEIKKNFSLGWRDGGGVKKQPPALLLS